MVTVIHGEDTLASRNYFQQLKKNAKNARLIDGTTLSVTDLVQAISGNGLFETKETIFIDDLFSKRKPGKETDALLAFLEKPQETPVVLYESKELTAKQLAVFKKATIQQFKIPQNIFAFLDAITPKDMRKALVLFHQVLIDREAEFIFFMIVRHIRILLQVAENTGSSEVKKLVPWQKKKLNHQASLFGKEQLRSLYLKLYEIDISLKTGALAQPLSHVIDFLLLAFYDRRNDY